jgi:GH24 family phage-related lysozyme (muramidase)
MPRMPTENELGLPSIRTPGVMRRVQDGVGPALERAGSVTRRIGDQIQANDEADAELSRREADKMKAQNDAINLTRARSDWTARRLSEEDKANPEVNPDYSKWESSYAANIRKQREIAAKSINDPVLRERFMAETDDDIARGTYSIRDRARTLDRGRREAEAMVGIENDIAAAAKPGLPQAESEAIIGRARASIDNLAMTGVFTPEKAIMERQRLAKRYAELKVGQDIRDNPLAASAWLEGGKGGVVGLIRKHEGYRARPYWDVNAYRVGYGSDTVTLEDGSVVKVKPGMEITREDAERDLQRRIGEFQAGIVQEVGPGPWASLPASAKAALTSVAYNYGSLPGEVVNAIKSGDLGQISAAVRDLSGHNGGINAKRRSNEADIIASGGDEISDLAAPEYYSVLSPEDRTSLQASADAEWAARQKETREASAVERYNLKQAMEDDLKQIEETGQATNINPQSIADTLGDDDAAKWLDQRKRAANIFEAVSTIPSLTNDEIEAHLDELEPTAGTAGFADRQAVYDAAEKKAKAVQDLRAKDPAKAVEDSPLVKKAEEGYDPARPETIQPVIRARLAAQEQIGIPPALRNPITKKEAYAIINPVQAVIDGLDATVMMETGKVKEPAARRAIAKQAAAEAEAQMRTLLDEVEKVYGPYSNQVMAYAIGQSVNDREVGNMAARVLTKVRKGIRPSTDDMEALAATTEAGLAEKAMDGQTPPAAPAAPAAAAKPATPRAAAQTGQAKPPPAAPAGGWPAPPSTAVQALVKDPSLAAAFDAKYGPGAAAQWMPQKQE